MRFFLATLSLSLVISGFLTAQSSQPDWPRWRGPQENGISEESDWDAPSLDHPKIVWQRNIGNGHSSVSIQGSRLYTMGNVKNEDIVYCLRVEDGTEVWRYSYGCLGGSFPGPRSTPVWDNDRVYAFSREGHVTCLDAKNGKLLWQRNVVAELGAENLMHGLSGSPYICGDLVVVNAGKSGMAFDKSTGADAWLSDPKASCGYATPVSFTIEGNRLLAIMTGKGLFVLDARTGRARWSYPWETEYDLNAVDPIVSGNYILLSSCDDDGSTLLEMNGDKPHPVWHNPGMKNLFSTWILLGGHIYGFNGTTEGKAAFTCFDFKTGAKKWAKESEYGVMTIAADKIIAIDQCGELFTFEATPSAYREISRCSLFPGSKRFRCWTTPVLCRGMLYCRNSIGDLICIDARKKGSSE